MKNLVYHVQNLFLETKRRNSTKINYLEIYDCIQKLIAITKKMDHTITNKWTGNNEKEHQMALKQQNKWYKIGLSYSICQSSRNIVL